MIEIGVLLVLFAVGCFIFCDNGASGFIPLLIGIFLLCSIKIFNIKPKIYIKDQYISTKIVDSENTNYETKFTSPVLIQKIRVDYPYTFVIDYCYYKIFPVPITENNKLETFKEHI